MTLPPWPLLVLLGVGAVLTALLALAFYRDPVKGMEEATHRPEKLPLVMIDRYLAVTIIQVGLIFFGTLEMIAVFCVAGAVMGLGDGLIYARAKLPHIKHTLSGVLALIGLAVTIYYMTGSA
ncbi:hypothetical protein KDD17_08320 [Sulfitobacter albidus]|uniref:Uncharacterized protein n=1 Tax=Sulfitobacter albidus TaxID=2829501 RepID=A0A975PL63_9RHOB|nr:hypothetical protein [Sulfitobacter albidus]QUJ75051.1 hypothetical protein KDD17_08320 [Sulfitobacter albidus]